MAKQRLNSNNKILLNLPNRVWIISFISGWVLSSLVSVSPHNGNASQLIAIESETELMFTDTGCSENKLNNDLNQCYLNHFLHS